MAHMKKKKGGMDYSKTVKKNATKKPKMRKTKNQKGSYH